MPKIIIIALVLVVLFFIFQRFSSNKNAPQNIQIGVEFLAENSQKEGIKSSESGLQYERLAQGEGETHPTAKSNVKVHYHGTLINGSVFDSSIDRGEPISFSLNQVIPSHLAYGNRGVASIPAGSLLIFDVELLAVN